MKTSQLIGPALDWAVATCLTGGELFQCGRMAHRWVLHCVGGEIAPYFIKDSGVVGCLFEPSTNWAHGGPIIERVGIDVQQVFGGGCEGSFSQPVGWQAKRYTVGGSINPPHFNAQTPLIAAMRCYVASNLGDEIKVPKDLA